MRMFQKGKKLGNENEEKLCMTLGAAMKTGGANAWDDNFTTVYDLAEATMARIMEKYAPDVPAAKL